MEPAHLELLKKQLQDCDDCPKCKGHGIVCHNCQAKTVISIENGKRFCGKCGDAPLENCTTCWGCCKDVKSGCKKCKKTGKIVVYGRELRCPTCKGKCPQLVMKDFKP